MRMQKPIQYFGEVHHGPNVCGGKAFLCGRKRVKKSGNTGAFLRVSKFFRQKRTKR
jgi:hypothetical protein